MNQKQIGLILIGLGILATVFVFMIKARNDFLIDQIIENQGGVCYVNGICLHDKEFTLHYFGGVLAAVLLTLGIYLTFFNKTDQTLMKQHKEVASALKEAKEKDEFHAFVSGFTEEEQRVLKAVHEQEGIQQSTLRYRTNISKTSLSLLLKSLEERGIISKKESGKTNEVYLVRKF